MMKAIEYHAPGDIRVSSIPIPQCAEGDLGRHGETFVSMGVSYWEANQRQKAVELTGQGIDRMEQAVQSKLIEESALAIPYGNLATMHRQLGQDSQAEQYVRKAARLEKTTQR